MTSCQRTYFRARLRAWMGVSMGIMCFVAVCQSLFVARAQAQGKPVARVYQQNLTTAQLEPDEATKKQAQQQLKGDAYQKWLTDAKYLKLAFSIWEPLQQQFLKERNITTNAGEVDTFFDYSERARKLQQTQMQRAAKEVEAQIAGGKLSAAEKEKAVAFKANLEQQLAAINRAATTKPTDQERQFAEKIIRAWKFDQALYKQYGGQVVVRPTTPQEPIGAYRKFLEEQEKKKSFEITDATYKKKFWEVFTPSKNVVTVPADKVDFSKPWWILIVERAQDAVKQQESGGKK